MIGSRHPLHSGLEFLDTHPPVAILESEYRRLLGYPKDHVPGERVEELAAWARQWFTTHGRPWMYLRETKLSVSNEGLLLDGTGFRSKQLHEHLRQTGAERAVLVVASAGAECEEYARQLWQEAKPDEYFFLEVYGSAVVEHLVASLSGRICDLAGKDGLMAVPHYSPGYTGWDVADQNKLFDLITRGLSRPFPGPVEVMSSGMLRPKKSLLGVFGLAARRAGVAAVVAKTPCENCAFNPCQYRRAPYRHNPDLTARVAAAPVLSRDAKYSVSLRALRKWSQERVRLETRRDGSIEARFRFDGTTCTNQGRPLAFDYTLTLSPAASGYVIQSADCRPAAGDDGYTSMCAYLTDAKKLMGEIAAEKPLLGRPLNDVLQWQRIAAPAGCHCSAESRLHKWGLALEAIHYSLSLAEAALVPPLPDPITASS